MRFRFLSVLLGLLLLCPAYASASLPVWKYHITETRAGGLLYITARLQRPHTLYLSVDDSAEPYIRYVQVYHAGRWISIRPDHNIWRLPSYVHSFATVRYQYDVAAAAKQLNRIGMAQRHGPVYHICPEAFLLRPIDSAEARVYFRVVSTDHTKFVTGYPQVGANTWTSLATDLSLGPDAAFGPLHLQVIHSHGANITVGYRGMPMSDKALHRWMERQSDEVETYFTGYPVRKLLVLLLPVAGNYTEGHARGGSGASVCITFGRNITASELMHDTVYVHELVHVCTPVLRSQWHWMEEGIATYLERIIPAQAGDMSAEDVWLGLTDDLPRGLPQPGDRGLNRTEDENRTYFGGALYWLMADIHIQLQTHGQHNLRDVMRAFHHNGAGITRLWDVNRLFALSRRATHVDVLHHLYRDMAFTPYQANLPRLWKDLGVTREGSRVTMKQAPMSDIRLSLTPMPDPAPEDGWMSVLSTWVLGTLSYVSAALPGN